ncbi:LysR family transcriptional regulator [Edaphobacter aggregans]|uniref:LysR family transcriptional regulator n=2 Tax=Edaphobacter aggregans TaxID=570835 RepID=A0A3R9R357_9BACT|nr:LysR family transcriptional regulator [Edaphobacter aggregans]
MSAKANVNVMAFPLLHSNLSPPQPYVQYLVRSDYDVLSMDDRDIELRHLRYFIAVAEELHFGRAANRLHLAQPPLSQQIRKLEEILGYPLFLRTSRAVKLTAAGEVFLERARRTLRNVHEDLAEARSIGNGDLGFLRVGFIGSAMLTPLPAMLGQYRRLYPKVQLQLSEFHTSSIIQSLGRGILDAGFLRDGGPSEALHVEPLFSEPFVAVLPHMHPLATRKVISAAQLRDEPFVFFSPSAGSLAYNKTISLCEEHGFRPHVVQEAPQWLTILALVGAGLGVSIAPACVRRIAEPNIVCPSLRGAHVTSDIELAYRSTEDRAVVHAFANIARTNFHRKPTRSR